MTITVLKEGETIHLIATDELLPEGQPMTLFTQAEVDDLIASYSKQANLQMASFLRGDEEESAEDLF